MTLEYSNLAVEAGEPLLLNPNVCTAIHLANSLYLISRLDMISNTMSQAHSHKILFA